MVRKLTEEQLARIREMKRKWEQYPAPCGISHTCIFNPCLPEYSDWDEDRGWLFCCNCFLKQRPQIGT